MEDNTEFMPLEEIERRSVENEYKSSYSLREDVAHYVVVCSFNGSMMRFEMGEEKRMKEWMHMDDGPIRPKVFLVNQVLDVTATFTAGPNVEAGCGPECSEMHTETGRCEIKRRRES